MFGHVKAERRALESTYEDVCTISRRKDVEEWTGITKQVSEPVYIDIICAISKSGNASKQTEAQHNIDFDMLLFVQPHIVIKAGDEITVKRFGRMDPLSPLKESYEVIGKPTPYVTHVQCKLKAVGLA